MNNYFTPNLTLTEKSDETLETTQISPFVDLETTLRHKGNFTIALSKIAETRRFIVLGGFEGSSVDLESIEQEFFLTQLIGMLPDLKQIGFSHIIITIPSEQEGEITNIGTPSEKRSILGARAASILDIAQNYDLKITIIASKVSANSDFNPTLINEESDRIAKIIASQTGEEKVLILTANFNTALKPLPLTNERELFSIGANLAAQQKEQVASVRFIDQGAPHNLIWRQAIDPNGATLRPCIAENVAPISHHFLGDPIAESATYVVFLSNR